MKLDRRLFIAAALVAPMSARSTEGFELISAQDGAREQRALAGAGTQKSQASVRTRALLPIIRVLSPQPSAGGVLRSPLRIELEFIAVGEEKIDVASFRVLYGMFRIDLTAKIRENASLTDRGLLAEQAKVPAGDHRLFLQVADENGRRAETELHMRVE